MSVENRPLISLRALHGWLPEYFTVEKENFVS